MLASVVRDFDDFPKYPWLEKSREGGVLLASRKIERPTLTFRVSDFFRS